MITPDLNGLTRGCESNAKSTPEYLEKTNSGYPLQCAVFRNPSNAQQSSFCRRRARSPEFVMARVLVLVHVIVHPAGDLVCHEILEPWLSGVPLNILLSESLEESDPRVGRTW